MKSARYIPQQILRQAALIAWTAGYGAVTPEALAEREQLSAAVANERLDEAVQQGLLKRESVLVGYTALYTVTSAGRVLARRCEHAGEYVYPKGLRTPRVSIKEARHTIACAGVRAALEHRYPDHRVIGELELCRDERQQKRRLASVEIRGTGGRRSHCPDLVIWPPATLNVPATPEVPATPDTPATPEVSATPSTSDTSDARCAPGTRHTPDDPDDPDTPSATTPSLLPVAVEVELTIKGKGELMANCRAWARCRYVEAVLYFAETRGVEEKLLEAIEECKAEEKIVVNPLREILEPQPGFTLIDE
jgi:DNA-binding Lrp family transcriptional regulator